MTIAIIGTGPAGLIAAEILSRAGQKVCVFDRKATPARKFLLAGRGGLNLTHSEPLESFLTHYYEQRKNLEPLIRAFTPDDLRRWCEGLGQETFIGSSGRVFPTAMKASPLLRAWLSRLEQNSVEFRMNRNWVGWDEKANLVFESDRGIETFTPKATLLALGGASWPTLGSDGSWQKLLSASGIDVSPLRSANCGFTCRWSSYFIERFAGQPLKSVAITGGDSTVKGEIMIDKNGIEGNAVYAMSAHIRAQIENMGAANIHIDLRPDMSLEKLIQRMNAPRARKSFSTWMQKSIHLSPLQTALLRESTPEITSQAPANIARLVKAVPLTLNTPFPLERAISSAGGISFDNLDKNMMLRSIPGLFAAGEMLDWEAPTGGYLLQACFATGTAAANGILDWLKH